MALHGKHDTLLIPQEARGTKLKACDRTNTWEACGISMKA
jgi:hypothetical protein